MSVSLLKKVRLNIFSGLSRIIHFKSLDYVNHEE